MLILFSLNIPNLTLHCLFVLSFSAKLHSNWKNIFQRIEEYKVLTALSSLTLCNPVDCSPLGSSVPGMLLTSILEWVTIPFSRVSSRSRNPTQNLSHSRQILYLLSHKQHKIPLQISSKEQPTPVPLPGKSDGGRSLIGYSPWGRKESDMTEQLHFHFQQVMQIAYPLDGRVTQ